MCVCVLIWKTERECLRILEGFFFKNLITTIMYRSLYGRWFQFITYSQSKAHQSWAAGLGRGYWRRHEIRCLSRWDLIFGKHLTHKTDSTPVSALTSMMSMSSWELAKISLKVKQRNIPCQLNTISSLTVCMIHAHKASWHSCEWLVT